MELADQIHAPTISAAWIREWRPTGIILSGGPNSVYDEGAPGLDPAVLQMAPVLGVCYGMNLIAQLEGGRIAPASEREYGRAHLEVTRPDGLFEGFGAHEQTQVWMSHGDQLQALPPGYVPSGRSGNSPFAAFRHESRPIFGVQFHPEVAHSLRGKDMLANFLFGVCHAKPTWTPGAFIAEEVERIRAMVGTSRVICGLSGGVDSSVAAALVHRAIGDQLTCIFVDTTAPCRPRPSTGSAG